MNQIFFAIIAIISVSIYAEPTDIAKKVNEPIKSTIQAPESTKILLSGGDEGSSASGGGGGKISVATNDYESDMINLGIECASSLGAQIPNLRSIDTIAKSIEDKISNTKPSRSIASEPSQACAVFSSQASSVILKRKFLREEVRPLNNQTIPSSGGAISK